MISSLIDPPGYAAVIGDLIGSTASSSRRHLQDELRRSLQRVNRRVDALQPLQITLGDEFQGMYATLDSALAATLALQLELGGQRVRIGLGIGPLSVFEPKSAPLQQDGPAWWAARRALEHVERTNWPATSMVRIWGDHRPPQRNWIQLTLPGLDQELTPASQVIESVETIVNSLLLRSDQLVASMDDRDCEIVLRMIDGETQAAIAAKIGVTPSAVSQRLKRLGGMSIPRSFSLLVDAT